MSNPLFNANTFKLGIFSANCDGGLTMSLAPERWKANWDDIAAMTRIADEAGIEFILPVAKWRGYQGKANIYGKHARVAHEVIQAITGLARSTVYAAIARLEKIRHLLRVERKVLWPGHNAINVYHVVIPWRADPLYNERAVMGWDKSNNKGPRRPDPRGAAAPPPNPP